MISAVINRVARIGFSVLDQDNRFVSGLADGVAATAYLLSDPETTLTPTVSEIGSTGRYVLSLTLDVDAIWYVVWDVLVDNDTVRYEETIEVIPAAADPAAIADALSTVQDTLENASGGHGIELSIMTSGPSRYRQG